MRGINKVIIIGNLGADPESRQFNNGGNVTNISVATSEQWTDKQTGEKREATEWHRVSLFNRLGEIAAQYLRKGSKVYIEGSLRTRKWQDQNGQDRYTTEIRADQMQMLDSAGGGQGVYQNNNTSVQGGNNIAGSYPNDNYGSGGNNNQNSNSFSQNTPVNNDNQPQGSGFGNQDSNAVNEPNRNNNNNAPAATQSGFNNQTSGGSEPMKDTPRDDDIPF